MIRDGISPSAKATDDLKSIVNVPGPLHPSRDDPAFTQVRVAAATRTTAMRLIAHFCTLLHGFGLKYAGEKELDSAHAQTRRLGLYFRQRGRAIRRPAVSRRRACRSDVEAYKAYWFKAEASSAAVRANSMSMIKNIVNAIVIGTVDSRILTMRVLYIVASKTRRPATKRLRSTASFLSYVQNLRARS